MNEERDAVVALPADLIFAARLRGAAGDVKLILARDVEDFLTKVRALQPRLAILDLDRRGLPVQQVVQQVKSASDCRLIAYVSHVREDLIEAARAGGADRVMARGAFVRDMAALLRPE